MDNKMNYYVKILILLCVISNAYHTFAQNTRVLEKPRIIVTSFCRSSDFQ